MSEERAGVMFLNVEHLSDLDEHGHKQKPYRVTWRDEVGTIRQSYFRTAEIADSFVQDVIATARGH